MGLVGYILLGILAFLLLLLCIPVRVQAVYRTDAQPVLIARYLFLKFDLLKETAEAKDEAAEAPEKKAKKKKTTEKKKAEKTPMEFSQMLHLALDALRAAKLLIRIIFRRLRFYHIRLHMAITGDDAAKTARNYGRVCAALSGVYATAQTLLNMAHPDVDIRPDYLGERARIDFEIRGRLAPIVLIWAVLRAGVPLLVTFLKTQKHPKPRKDAPERASAAS